MALEFSHYLIELFQQKANPKRAVSMKAYMRDKFDFFGVDATNRKEIERKIITDLGKPVDTWPAEVKFLWNQPQRELQQVTQDISKRLKWYRKPDSIVLFEWMATHKSWWDTVDFIAANLMGPYFLEFPEKIDSITSRWNRSDDMWLIRCSIIFQLKYKEKVDLDLVYNYITPHLASKEFFIQKAIGWILREISKTNPDWVADLVDQHELKTVSKREAIKYLPK